MEEIFYTVLGLIVLVIFIRRITIKDNTNVILKPGIVSISNEVISKFYESLSEDDKHKFYKLVRGHRCYHGYCCDHDELSGRNRRTELSISRFLYDNGFDFSTLSTSSSYFVFGDTSSTSRTISKYEKKLGSRRSYD